MTGAAELLPELARCWSRLYPGCTVTVVAVAAGRRHLRLAQVQPAGAVLLRDLVSIDPPELADRPEELRSLVHSVCAGEPPCADEACAQHTAAKQTAAVHTGSASRAILLAHRDQPVGAILLEAESNDALTADPAAEFPRLTAAVLSQLHALDSRPVAEDFQQQLQEQRLESLAEYAAGAGHEINNPATTVAGRARLLLEHETDPARRQSLETIGAEALRIRDMIGDTMVFGRPPVPQLEQISAVAALQQMIQRFGESLREAGGKIRLEVAPEAEAVQLLADPAQFEITTGAVLSNAVHAVLSLHSLTDAGLQPIVVQLDREESNGQSEAAGNGMALITVSDHGCGFSETDARHLFDPFYSGRQAGRGLGFGLSKAWRIIRAHGGQIELVSVREPTVLALRWPLAAPAD
ncbi:MAG: HAMP domain-containing histidine kinase [Planctomycetaceae bacterium]|nr:HAMP domain-containing histidine kinase [Planctomycetaceae bacterium]